MGFGAAIIDGFRHGANVHVRASRSAFWWWVLFVLIVETILLGLVRWFGSAPGHEETGSLLVTVLGVVVTLALLLLTVAVGVRRLHDSRLSGAWLWLAIIPLGIVVLIGFLLRPGSSDLPRHQDGSS